MKKYNIFLLIIILFWMACSGDIYIKNKINEINKDGNKMGTWLVKEEGTGFFIFDTYKEGKKNGLHKTFTFDGKLIVVGQYKNDQKVNKWIYYSSTDGKINRINVYKNDSVYKLKMIRIINIDWN